MSSGTSEASRREILRERARQLARVVAPERGAEEHLEVVTFQLAHERYAIESRWVREVCRIHELTPVPGVPRFLLGVINFRGEILSVLDVKRFFDLPDKGLTDRTLAVIVRAGDMDTGVLADLVFGLQELAADAFAPNLPTATGIRQEYVRGVTADRLILLDMPAILAGTRRQLEEASHV